MTEQEHKKRLGSQLTKYFGSRDKVKVFAQECKAVGFDLSDYENIKRIALNPEEFVTLINYSELGLLPKLGNSITKLKG